VLRADFSGDFILRADIIHQKLCQNVTNVDSAMSSDVWKRYALPVGRNPVFGAAPPKLGVARIQLIEQVGRPQAFRTSVGIAAPSEEFLGKAIHESKFDPLNHMKLH
jgi:hypothetical protein